MESVNKICRSCLNTKESFTYFIHHNVSQEMYWFCTSVEVLPNDELPKSLCDGCFDLLVKFSRFKQTCNESNNTLTALYPNKHSEFTLKHESGEPTSNTTDVRPQMQSIKQEFSEDVNIDNDFFDETNLNEIEANIKFENRLNTNDGAKLYKKKISKTYFWFSCEKCNRRFVDPDRFEAHKGAHDGKPVIIQCSICKKIFKKWQSLARHKASQHTIFSLDQRQCPTCGKIYTNPESLRHHQTIHSRTQPFMCDLCGGKFKTKITLKHHQVTHEENRSRTHECELCGNKYHDQKALVSHRNKVHKHRIYICDLCSKPFRCKTSLAKHILHTHEGQKRHKCDVCDKFFATNHGKLSHMRYHSGERPFPCRYCPKQFIARKTLIDHEKIHTGSKPYKCGLCTQAFAQKGTLNRHMKVHEKAASSTVKEAFL